MTNTFVGDCLKENQFTSDVRVGRWGMALDLLFS